MKKIFIFLLIILIITGCSNNNGTYYEELKNQCNQGDSCCFDSVEYMQENNLKLTNKNLTCEIGFKKDRLKSISSYTWCVSE